MAQEDARLPHMPMAVDSPRSPSMHYAFPLSTGVVYSTEVNAHKNQFEDHYECPERIIRTWQLIQATGVDKKLKMLPIRPVHKQEAMLIHTEDQWNAIEQIQHMSSLEFDNSKDYYESQSLYVNAETTRCARLSCGGVIEACVAVASDMSDINKSFALVRPPGHHAEPSHPMGFCFFNNVAVACRVVQQTTRVKRILVLDWDVHHGNGTQKAFEDDPSVLYISLHRYEGGNFYPSGTYGGMHSCGEGAGLGYSVNIPWPKEGMGDAEYIHAFQSIVLPIAMEFAPQLVIISAGFDAAEGDPLGGCKVSPTGYAHMTHMLSGLAGGRLVVALEGGYNVESVAKSALAVARVLVGESPPELPPLRVSEVGTETIWLVAKEQSRYWKSLGTQYLVPRAELREDDTISIPEILKIYRQNYLADRGMMHVPLLSGDMENRFGAQVMCTANILSTPTLVFFLHEFGNIQSELESASTCDLNTERSYLVDFSRDIIAWVTTEGHALLDVNLYPKPMSLDDQDMKPGKASNLLTKEVLVYLWDNFIELSTATNIVLIGHGPGCQPMVNLLKQRYASSSAKFKGIVEVITRSTLPSISSGESDDLRRWYSKHSLIIVSDTHPAVAGKLKKKHGRVSLKKETQPIKLLTAALPEIQDFVRDAFKRDNDVIMVD